MTNISNYFEEAQQLAKALERIDRLEANRIERVHNDCDARRARLHEAASDEAIRLVTELRLAQQVSAEWDETARKEDAT